MEMTSPSVPVSVRWKETSSHPMFSQITGKIELNEVYRLLSTFGYTRFERSVRFERSELHFI
jgi:hypothetical protein